ncbi:MAG: hypothetical protein ACR2PI_00645 [Hyphomicrobiaceae bacterium]
MFIITSFHIESPDRARDIRSLNVDLILDPGAHYSLAQAVGENRHHGGN